MALAIGFIFLYTRTPTTTMYSDCTAMEHHRALSTKIKTIIADKFSFWKTFSVNRKITFLIINALQNILENFI